MLVHVLSKPSFHRPRLHCLTGGGLVGRMLNPLAVSFDDGSRGFSSLTFFVQSPNFLFPPAPAALEVVDPSLAESVAAGSFQISLEGILSIFIIVNNSAS